MAIAGIIELVDDFLSRDDLKIERLGTSFLAGTDEWPFLIDTEQMCSFFIVFVDVFTDVL